MAAGVADACLNIVVQAASSVKTNRLAGCLRVRRNSMVSISASTALAAAEVRERYSEPESFTFMVAEVIREDGAGV